VPCIVSRFGVNVAGALSLVVAFLCGTIGYHGVKGVGYSINTSNQREKNGEETAVRKRILEAGLCGVHEEWLRGNQHS
jgi:hypothetical protein